MNRFVFVIICILVMLNISSNIFTKASDTSDSPRYLYSDDDGSSYEPMESEVSASSDDDRQSSASKGIQFMVTRRMRRTLEDELGYLPEEVDQIEPQIAAVVIERRLARPLNGMPDSWRIVHTDYSKKFELPFISKFIKNSKSLISKVWSGGVSMSLQAAPFVLPLVALRVSIPIIIALGRNVIARIQFESADLYSLKGISSKGASALSAAAAKKGVRNTSSKRPNVDIRTFNKLTKPSLFDSLSRLRFKLTDF